MIELDGNSLSIEAVVSAARFGEKVVLSKTGRENILRGRTCLEKILESRKPVYGINTGFGIFADRSISEEKSAQLSRNLILSHAVGTGAFFSEEVVRAAMLVRANTLAKGFSGVRLIVVETLIEMLNRGVVPCVPSQGSLGSSGDLGPLSHLAMVFTTDQTDREEDSGLACYNGQIMSGKEAMGKAGLERIILGPKEGLAINNGATFAAAIAALAVYDAGILSDTADIALAMSLEALLGCAAAFDPRIHGARGQDGQIRTAGNIRQLINGSSLIDSSARVQDAYSLRCAPQVHGAVRDTLSYVRNVVSREINAATDNPLLFDECQAISGGNFHGEPIGMVMDFLGIAVAELAAISERRIFRLIDAKLNNGLPPMLVENIEAAGLNSGLMMPQYTAASLVLENQTLAAPDSVHSLPTSGEQEDHNANATTASRHASQIIANAMTVLSIELFTAKRALDLRFKIDPGLKLGRGTMAAYEKISAKVKSADYDRYWKPDIDLIRSMVTGEMFRVKFD